MSILPLQAQQRLTTSQVAALDRQYAQTTSLIPQVSSSTASSGDSLFVSLDAQVALQRFEQTTGGSATDPTQASTASLVQSLTSPASPFTPNFANIGTAVALLQYQAKQKLAASQAAPQSDA